MKTTTVPIGDIKPNPDNPRHIKDDKFKKLVTSIKDFPQMLELRPIVVDSDGIILGGNMRLKACQAAGLKEVPVIYADQLTEDQKREFIIKDNVGFGEWDWDVLANEWDEVVLDAWGLDVPAFDIEEDKEAEEDGYEVPDEIQTDIQPGDLFEIGLHRLLCGDSTDKEQVSRLMNGEKADMVFTDPPYGVNVKGGKSKGNLIMGDLTQTAIPFAFEMCVEKATADKAHFYFCGGENNLMLYQKLFDRYLHSLPKHLIWVKNGFVMKQNGYHNQFEIIFHGYKQGSGALWYGGRKEDEASDVWQIKRDASSTYLHPTQKPIELPSRAIKNSSKKQALIYEPFGGSGSTMVAAHQLDRRCYGMELDPKYCQVIVDRMLTLDPTLEIKRNGEPYATQRHGTEEGIDA